MDQELVQYLDERFGRLEQRLDGHDGRFDAIEQRLDGHETRFEGFDRRFDNVNERIRHNGVLIEGLPIPLLARAIFVVDKNNKITYCEYVPEVTTEPNYDKALAALKAAAA